AHGSSPTRSAGPGIVGQSVFFSSRRRHTRSKRDWSSDVCSSDLNRRRTLIKILQWDGSGFWILMKRLDRNSFHWPDTPDELRKVTLKEIHWLCDGLSLNPSGAFEERHPKIVV